MAKYIYPDSTPVDEPTSPVPRTAASAPKKEKAKPVVYPKDVPVDEPTKKMAKGGTASSRADGIAQKGKTRGTMVMCGGGMTKRK